MSPNDSAFTDTLISREVRERIVIVGVTFPHGTQAATEAGLDELALLVDTAGADVAGRIVQRRTTPDPATYLGKGKAEELLAVCLEVDADTVVFDDDLSPAQQRNLEKILGRTAIDRTAVILDIFAQNARTPEGRAQVELALLRYRLPRLRGRGHSLSQQAGGIGTRGPGETQLEVDRRRLVQRMTRLEADLRQLDRTRRVQRRGRQRGRQRTVSLVGLHQRRQVDPAEPAVRVRRAGGGPALLDARPPDPPVRPARRRARPADRHGRASCASCPTRWSRRSGPRSRSVLESDLIVHVVDGSAPDLQGQIDAVHAVLAEIGADRTARAAGGQQGRRAGAAATTRPARRPAGCWRAHPGSVLVSARTGRRDRRAAGDDRRPPAGGRTGSSS